MVSIRLINGGPGDGEVVKVVSFEQQMKLREKEYGGGFFWLYLHSCNRDGSKQHVYIEDHPHGKPDFTPPNKLEMSYNQEVTFF